MSLYLTVLAVDAICVLAVAVCYAGALEVGPRWTYPTARAIRRKHRAAKADLREALRRGRR
jgi:hypothetical protein